MKRNRASAARCTSPAAAASGAGAASWKLAVGQATITVARERSHDLGLAAGNLHLVARTEVWAYPDLF